MIMLTRLNDVPIMVNADQIEFVEQTPDTVISLISGKKIIVKESIETVVERFIEYKRKIFSTDFKR